VTTTRDESLTLGLLRALAAGRNGDAEVVSADPAGATRRQTAADVTARAARLAAGLTTLGVARGDRVATLSWNVAEHVEAYWAVPCMGATLHTLNPRLLATQTAQTLQDSGARVLLVHADLLVLAREIAAIAGGVEHLVVFRGAAEDDATIVDYERLLAAQPDGFAWPQLSEHEPAGLCFTSGTTGAPKGVLYTHRMLVLHALTMAAFDPYAIPARDRVLAVVPMFHAMGWNLPYIAALTGASLVLPDRDVTPARLASLIDEERVTFSCGVPTVWADLLAHVERSGDRLPSLRTIACGGSRVPETLMRRYDARGVTMLQGWGMTETGPGAARVFDDPLLDPAQRWDRREHRGWLRPLYEARVRGADGDVVPTDGASAGELEVRGPMVIREYFGNSGAGDRFRDGWLRTGDIGTLDERGWLRLLDRDKDVIKSGGEWISSLELESAILAHDAVVDVAVIAAPDERWAERPLPCVVLEDALPVAALRAFLRDKVPSWWSPERIAVLDAIPRNGVGKVDKGALRERLAAGELTILERMEDTSSA
jgi:fatty-acyl-CoA synthase